MGLSNLMDLLFACLLVLRFHLVGEIIQQVILIFLLPASSPRPLKIVP